VASSKQGKSEPFSIRLAKPEEEFVGLEAQRLRRSRSSIVESYTAEAIRMRRYPGIAYRGEDQRRRAWVVGTGLDVWEVVALLGDFANEQKLADEYGLTPGQIRIALAYADEFASEIEEQRALGRRSEDELHSRYPFLQTFEQATAIAGS
jgi:uncharacterized protein (DUF433 family)